MQLFMSPSWTTDSNYIIASKAEGSLGTYTFICITVTAGME